MAISVGMTHSVSVVVDSSNTADFAGSGSLPVFATPFMIALMELAAAELCQKELEDGITTVGTNINVSHLAATAKGAVVKAVATVTSADGRRFTFDVEAYDNAGLIGKGTHERFSVKIDKFMAKAEERKAL